MSSTTGTNGSTVTYTYNPDGSYVETVVSTDAQGTATTTVYSVNAQGQLLTEDIGSPDGSTSHQAFSYFPNGTYQQVVQNLVKADGSHSDATYIYNPDGSLQQIVKDAVAVDGSRVDTRINYNFDQSYQEMVAVTAATGQVTSMTNTAVNAQGQLMVKDVSTPAGTDDHTQYQYFPNGSGYQQVVETVLNADGSRSDSTTFYNPDGTYFQIVKDAIAADGSRVDTRINYNYDQSYQETVTVTAANGQVTSMTNTAVNAQGQLMVKDVSTPAGTDDHTQYQYFPNGSGYQQVVETVLNADGSRSDSTTFYNPDGTYFQIVKDAIAADGSRVDTRINYNFDQSYQETVTVTAANGQVTSTTNSSVNAQGQLLVKDVSTSAGTDDHTQYQYFPVSGDYQQVMETVLNADGSRSDSTTLYNPDRTYFQIVKDAIAADGSRVDTRINYNYDQSYQETVTLTAANGQVTSTTNSSVNAQGQLLVKDVSTSAGTDDHTQYQYFANGGYQQVVEGIVNADGSRVDTWINYNFDRSYQETDTATAANGQVTSTTNSFANAQGQLVSKYVSTSAGTTDLTQYQYYANGGYQQVMENVVNADGSHNDSRTAYNWDGSYHQIVKHAIAADGSQVDTTFNYNPDGSYLETVVSLAANGQQLSQDTYTTSINGATFIYNPDGSYVETVVSTDAQGAATTTVYSVNAQAQLVSKDIRSPDGSTSHQAYNSGGSLLQFVSDTIAADGSRVDTAINYNPDQSYQETVAVTAANGQLTSTTNSLVNAQGQLLFKDVSTPVGTDDRTQYQYSPNGGGFQQVMETVVNADGSRVNTTINYNFDQSYQEMVTATAANGQMTSTTNSSFNAQGQLLFKDVSTPAGTDDRTQYQYFPNSGDYQQVMETVVNADGSRSDSTTLYNPDGTYVQIMKDAVAADGSRVNTTINYNFDQSYQEMVSATAANGQVTSTTNTSVNAQGQLLFKDVSTPAGTDHTQYLYFQYSGDYQQIVENVVNADGSRSDSTTLYNPDGTYVQIMKDAVAPDGSRVNTTINYNFDQSYQEMVTATTANGQVTSTTNTSVNAQGQLLFKDVSTPVGTDHTQYQYFQNGGGLQQVMETVVNTDGSHGDSMTLYNPNGTYVQVVKDTIAADGSRVDTSINYNSDRSYQETDTAIAANGQVTSTTNTSVNAQGQVLSKDVSTPAGTNDYTQYQYFANGGYQQVTENVVNADGSHSDWMTDYNWNGSYHQVVSDAIAANGQQLNQNTYTPSLDGSYSDSWVSQDGSHGAYGWDNSSSEYHATWYDNNGVQWTDDYQYTAGGSPQTAGSAFFESYTSSDGSSGTRQYDPSTGLASISWDSSATGFLSGTSQTATGFVGLQNDGELTNSQGDLTFFNPAASPAFSAFLTSVEPHA